MPLKQTMPLGSGQLIRLYLEEFLLHLLRHFEHAQSIGLDKKPASYKLKNTEEILDLITNYLKQHIHEQITLEQICHDNSAGLGYQSVQYFSRQFKNLTGMTPTEYSSSIKSLAENSFPE